ncbi:hypothetical protein [Botrimarina sp.]|uniref:hypothetical protein n=1 Tax=Botrimarina sp. TaxID=2795802 RepID=UPI0032EC13DC
MPRLKPIGGIVVATVCLLRVAGAEPSLPPMPEEGVNELRAPSTKRPTPWSAPPGAATGRSANGSVADWATTQLAIKAEGQPAGPPPASTTELPVVNPFRTGAADTAGLPNNNPLRIAEAEPAAPAAAPARRPGSSATSPAAAAAFTETARPEEPQPLEAPQPNREPAPLARIAVGAAPVEPAPMIPEEPASGDAEAASLEEPVAATEPPAAFAPPPTAAWDGPSDSGSGSTQSAAQPPRVDRQATASGMGQPGPAAMEGPQEASLTLQKRGPSEAQIGKPCRFAIRIRNTGAGVANDVVLRDEVPAGTRLEGTQPAADVAGGRLTWRLGDLAPGQEQTVEIRLTPLREGAIGSVAQVTMAAAASASTAVTRPQLTIAASVAPQVRVGEEQTVTIELHNPGTGTATGVMLLGDLPALVSHPAGKELEFEVGTLAAGETRRIELALHAEAAGRVASSLAAVADGDLRAERAVAFEVVAPKLHVSVDGSKRRYLERPAAYTIGIDNPGTAPARDVRLVTHLPRSMRFVSANNLGEYDAESHSVYWSLAELPDGQRGEVEVVAVPTTPGEQTLRVESQAAGGLRSEATHPIVVDGVASLAFEVRDLADPIEVGGETTYEVRVLNEGTKAATGVRVVVESPRGMRIKAAEGETAHRASAERVEFAPLASLDPGAKVAFRVRVAAAEAGDQRVVVLVESDDLSGPVRREESTRVLGDE